MSWRDNNKSSGILDSFAIDNHDESWIVTLCRSSGSKCSGSWGQQLQDKDMMTEKKK
jgi:hypothetical protein